MKLTFAATVVFAVAVFDSVAGAATTVTEQDENRAALLRGVSASSDEEPEQAHGRMLGGVRAMLGDVYYVKTEDHSANACPDHLVPVTKGECLAAVQSLVPPRDSQGRTHLLEGYWTIVPPGCSIQWARIGGGDYAAHWGNANNGINNGDFPPVCKAAEPQEYVKAEFTAKTCPDHRVRVTVTKEECLVAVKSVLRRNVFDLVYVHMVDMPNGCSVGAYNGFWNTNKNGKNNGTYNLSPVCYKVSGV